MMALSLDGLLRYDSLRYWCDNGAEFSFHPQYPMSTEKTLKRREREAGRFVEAAAKCSC